MQSSDLLRAYKTYTGGDGLLIRGQVTDQRKKQTLGGMGFRSPAEAKAAIDAGLVTISKEKKNNAGGFVFKVDDMARARRFIILGCDKGTYYQTAPDLLGQNLDCLKKLIDGGHAEALVNMLVDISTRGLVPREDTVIFVLAWLSCSEVDEVRSLAFKAVPKILRTPTAQFAFIFKWRAKIRESQGKKGHGWGRGMRTAFLKIYTEKPLKQLAYHVTKYQSRDGASQRDVLRLLHPSVGGKRKRDGSESGNLDPGRNLLFSWAVNEGKMSDELEQTFYELSGRAPTKMTHDEDDVEGGAKGEFAVLPYLKAIHEALRTSDPERAVALIEEFGLVREQVSTTVLSAIPVWGALLKDMPLTALIRNLGSMTSKGVFDSDELLGLAVRTLSNETAVEKARLHPLNVYKALKQYDLGRGDKGSLSWAPVRQIKDALNVAFKSAFKYAPKTGKRILCALDISGSMGSMIAGFNMSCMEAEIIMCMSFLRVGDHVDFAVFNNGLKEIRRPRIDSNVEEFGKAFPSWSGGSTDCAQPMLYALEKGEKYDAFVIFTDNETFAGKVKPFEALAHYALESRITDAKLVVCAMTSSGFTIADPNNPNMLDIVGLDSSVPQIVTDFISGTI